MKSYDVTTEGGKPAVQAKASTRAGLALMGVMGAFEAAGGRTSELDEKNEREFSVEAEEFSDLLGMLVTEALKAGKEHGEMYEDIRFSLITESKAEGTFIGRPATGGEPASLAKTKGGVFRDESGDWEALIVLK